MAHIDRFKESSKVLIITLLLNILVSALKLFFGLIANSLSMIADAMHSLFDSSSNIIGLVALKFASMPPDEEHPYGHQKFENFATLGIAMLIFLTCFEIIQSAIGRFQEMIQPNITPLTFYILFLCLTINIGTALYERKKGNELNSGILIADSYHTGSDILASISVITGFILIKLGYPIFDPIIALIIAGLIGISGYRIVKRSSKTLCDASVVNPTDIEKIALNVAGVRSCHKIRTRGTDNETYIDLHIRIDPNTTVEYGHRISHRVSERIKEKICGVKDITIHIEPSE
ncbi:MAG TPA: cation transporter [Candidatus Altiarchaeales archaeon]|nr:cation transporter [Candidatus Altiarchaeales archaeon]